MSLKSYIEAMPKAELHVHLEGAILPETVLFLAERNKVKLPVDTVEGLQKLYEFVDFPHFVTVFNMVISCLQKPEDYIDVVMRFGQEMARQNIRYAEVTWSPQSHVWRGIPFSVLLEALNEGRAKAKHSDGVELRWIPDIVRSWPDATDDFHEEAARWISSDEALAGGVVALGLGGFEVGYPPERFEVPFRLARERGLPGNPHAGETEGAASVWGAIRSLKARRIGHGVRAVEDPALVKYLAEQKIPLEVNPTSNLCLKVYPSYTEHPLKKLVEAGCIVTINSDDPPLFNTTLTDEYLHAVEDCGLTLEQLENAVLNAVRYSYLPEASKVGLVAAFEADFATLRRQHQNSLF